MNQRRNNRTLTISENYANPINDAERQTAQSAIVGALIGTYGTDECKSGDDGLTGYWHKYSEFWDCKLKGVLQHGNISLPFRAVEQVAVVHVIDTNETKLYYIADAKTLDLTQLAGMRVEINLQFVRTFKETIQ